GGARLGRRRRPIPAATGPAGSPTPAGPRATSAVSARAAVLACVVALAGHRVASTASRARGPVWTGSRRAQPALAREEAGQLRVPPAVRARRQQAGQTRDGQERLDVRGAGDREGQP